MNDHSQLHMFRSAPRSPSKRRGKAVAAIVLVLIFIIVAVLGVLLTIWDGRAGQTFTDEDPPVGSVEGNLAQLANWASTPIRDWIESKGSVPSDQQGEKILQEELPKRPYPVFYPPTPVEPDGNPTYKKTNNGFDLVFPGRNGKPVVCSFSSAGAYEGATGLGAFASEAESVNNPLEGVAP